ncbi:MAG: hypothetical protein KJZ72_00870 [Anaerolineales bacterium]|nr:hypothetical protein [Anaerolineales bacterium]
MDKGLPFIHNAAENSDQLALLNGFEGENAVSAFIGFQATFQLRRQIGTWLLGHSYNFLSICGLKINSASRGGRAAKNAIGSVNNTLNILHVKVLSRSDYFNLVNVLLFPIPAQVIK